MPSLGRLPADSPMTELSEALLVSMVGEIWKAENLAGELGGECLKRR